MREEGKEQRPSMVVAITVPLLVILIGLGFPVAVALFLVGWFLVLLATGTMDRPTAY